MIARRVNQRYFIHTFFVSWLCNYCTICKIDKKLSRNNSKLSRNKVGQWLESYPKIPWWILNKRVADYCMIITGKKSHNTTVLGKYLPHKQTSWQLESGLPSVNMNASRVLINFDCVSHAYRFAIICLCVCLILFVCLMDFPLVFFESIIGSVYLLVLTDLFVCARSIVFFICTLIHSHFHSLTQSHSHSHSLICICTHSLAFTLTLTHSHFHSLAHSLTFALTLTDSHLHLLTRICTHNNSLTFALSHSYLHSHSLTCICTHSLTRIYTHTDSLAFALTHS